MINLENEVEKIKAMLITFTLLEELFDIIINDHPEIMTKALIQIVEKHPELFKKKE